MHIGGLLFKDKIVILKVISKYPCLRSSLLISVQKNRSAEYFSTTNAYILSFDSLKKVHNAGIVSSFKNDTITP